MDETAPSIVFDEAGVCSYCHYFDKEIAPVLKQIGTEECSKSCDRIIEKIKKEGADKEYDCILGLSGGVDSSYLAYLVKKKFGLRPLAVHVDAGWNSELAVNNIEMIVSKLGIDLFTFVVDWKEMRELQLAYFKSSVANQDIPQDHAFFAAIRKIARKRNIKYVITGSNLATESLFVSEWGYNAMDARNLKAIFKKFGKGELKKFPIANFFSYYFLDYLRGIKTVKLLNYVPYNKAEAKQCLIDELGWKDYGGKHYESRFTRFYQSYYLPSKFNYDKRKPHLSSLILDGQITREQAVEELSVLPWANYDVDEIKEFISRKLGVSRVEFDAILNAPKSSYLDYPSDEKLYGLFRKIYRRFKSSNV